MSAVDDDIMVMAALDEVRYKELARERYKMM
jgi:hypothetical protein